MLKRACELIQKYYPEIEVIDDPEYYIKSDGHKEDYINHSYCIGGRPFQIILGIYDREDCKLISLFHELGHKLLSREWMKSVEFRTYPIERECWLVGQKVALSWGITFSIESILWAYKELQTYEHYAIVKRKGKKMGSFYVIKCGCGDPACMYFVDGPQNGTKREKKKKEKQITMEEYFSQRYGTKNKEVL